MRRKSNRYTNDEMKNVLQSFDMIAAEIGKHEDEDAFAMDCPFCGIAQSFEVLKSFCSVSGRCSVCGIPVHIKMRN